MMGGAGGVLSGVSDVASVSPAPWSGGLRMVGGAEARRGLGRALRGTRGRVLGHVGPDALCGIQGAAIAILQAPVEASVRYGPADDGCRRQPATLCVRLDFADKLTGAHAPIRGYLSP